MNNLLLALDGAWKVLAASLVLGAGLPFVFAFGVRARAFAAGDNAEIASESAGRTRRRPIGNVLAAVCLLLVVAGVALGITVVVAAGFGKAVSFEHVVPTLVGK